MTTFAELPGWGEFKQAMIRFGYAPSMVFPSIVAPPAEVQPHGPFRSHIDLPLLTTEEVARMGPVWEAVFELVRTHPEGCGCNPTIMAWRAAYATAEILLRLPDAEGVFRRRYIGDDGYIYGWRCSLHEHTIERTSKGHDQNGARKAYEDHMKTKHPKEGQDGD